MMISSLKEVPLGSSALTHIPTSRTMKCVAFQDVLVALILFSTLVQVTWYRSEHSPVLECLDQYTEENRNLGLKGTVANSAMYYRTWQDISQEEVLKGFKMSKKPPISTKIESI